MYGNVSETFKSIIKTKVNWCGTSNKMYTYTFYEGASLRQTNALDFYQPKTLKWACKS